MVDRDLPRAQSYGQGRVALGGEPLVIHCNHYNYWFQHTLRLDPALEMDPVIVDVAEGCARSLIDGVRRERELPAEPGVITRIAHDLFAELGFGMMDFSETGPEGGVVRTPVSHYGVGMRAVHTTFNRDQNLFDQGFAAAALGLAYGHEPGSVHVVRNQCPARHPDEGEIELAVGSSRPSGPRPSTARPRPFRSPGRGIVGSESAAPAPPVDEHNGIDEAAIHRALAQLDLRGDEEGLVVRFGVLVTHQLANFYQGTAHALDIRARALDMLELTDQLLLEAGRRCAFHTFGGIMLSAEWDAVVRPHCRTTDDWIRGIVAVINAFGWGTWRVIELDERRVVMRVWDDYESGAWLALQGPSQRPISQLVAGGVEGLMGLIHLAGIQDGPELDEDLFRAINYGMRRFEAKLTRNLACGDPYTEVVASLVED